MECHFRPSRSPFALIASDAQRLIDHQDTGGLAHPVRHQKRNHFSLLGTGLHVRILGQLLGPLLFDALSQGHAFIAGQYANEGRMIDTVAHFSRSRQESRCYTAVRGRVAAQQRR
jgi:hypothetical protein